MNFIPPPALDHELQQISGLETKKIFPMLIEAFVRTASSSPLTSLGKSLAMISIASWVPSVFTEWMASDDEAA